MLQAGGSRRFRLAFTMQLPHRTERIPVNGNRGVRHLDPVRRRVHHGLGDYAD